MARGWIGLLAISFASCVAPPATPARTVKHVAEVRPRLPLLETPPETGPETRPETKGVTPTIDPGCQPRTAVDVAPLFAPLFERGQQLSYAMVDDVDPHAEGGGRVVTRHVIDCEVGSLRRFRGAYSSELACQVRGEEGTILPEQTLSFLANDRALWMGRLALDDESAQAAMGERPSLIAAPRAVVRANEGCVSIVQPLGSSTCIEERCGGGMWGPTRDRRCFSSSRGLESLRIVNILGPRTTTWKLLSTKRGERELVQDEPSVPFCDP